MSHRRAIARGLLVLATLVGIAAILAVWVKRQALDTAVWTDTSARLLENHTIRSALAGYLVDQAIDEQRLEGRLDSVLPPRLDPLAPVAAQEVERVAPQIAEQALARPRVQALWRTANEKAHKLLLKVIDGGGSAVSTQGGVVTLDLRDIAGQVVSPNLAGKLPESAAHLVILRSDDLKTAQKVAKALRTLAYVLPILGLLLFAAALATAPAGQRRATLTGVGLSLIVTALVALALRRFIGHHVITELAEPGPGRDAAQATWTIATTLLVSSAVGFLLVGAVTLLGSWLASGQKWAVAGRRRAAPVVAQYPAVAYGGAFVLFLLLVAWGPFPATRLFLPALILLALLLLGVHLLVRQMAREAAPG